MDMAYNIRHVIQEITQEIIDNVLPPEKVLKEGLSITPKNAYKFGKKDGYNTAIKRMRANLMAYKRGSQIR